jgi:hypothetical protein
MMEYYEVDEQNFDFNLNQYFVDPILKYDHCFLKEYLQDFMQNFILNFIFIVSILDLAAKIAYYQI